MTCGSNIVIVSLGWTFIFVYQHRDVVLIESSGRWSNSRIMRWLGGTITLELSHSWFHQHSPVRFLSNLPSNKRWFTYWFPLLNLPYIYVFYKYVPLFNRVWIISWYAGFVIFSFFCSGGSTALISQLFEDTCPKCSAYRCICANLKETLSGWLQSSWSSKEVNIFWIMTLDFLWNSTNRSFYIILWLKCLYWIYQECISSLWLRTIPRINAAAFISTQNINSGLVRAIAIRGNNMELD